jgi:hypothetical protein
LTIAFTLDPKLPSRESKRHSFLAGRELTAEAPRARRVVLSPES